MPKLQNKNQINNKTGDRYGQYRPETVDRLIVIRDLLYKHGLTIAGVKKLLRDGNFPSSGDEFVAAMPTNAAPAVAAAPVATHGTPAIDAQQLDRAIEILTAACDILKNA